MPNDVTRLPVTGLEELKAEWDNHNESHSNLFFPVAKQNLYTSEYTEHLSDFVLELVEDHMTTVRTDTGRPLGVVGKDYHLTPMRDLVEHTEAMFFEAISPRGLENVVKKDYVSWGGAKVMREYIFNNISTPIVTRKATTTVSYRVLLRTSYDGSVSNRYLGGAIDWWCSNGIIMGEYDIIAKRHSKNFSLDSFVDLVRDNVELYYKNARTYAAWGQTDISYGRAFSIIDELTVADRVKENLKKRYLVEVKDRGNNLWALASTLTFYSSHSSEEFKLSRNDKDNEQDRLLNRSSKVTSWLGHDAFTAQAA